MVSRPTLALWYATTLGTVYGWSGFEGEQSGLWARIEPIPTVTNPHSPVAVTVSLSNRSPNVWSGRIELSDLVDDWVPTGPSNMPVVLSPRAMTAVAFNVCSGPFVFDALYPIHVRITPEAPANGEPLRLVRIFEVQRPPSFPSKSTEPPPPLEVHPDRVVPLWTDQSFRFGWQRDGETSATYHALGWTGSDPTSRAFLGLQRIDELTPAFTMHVPYVPKPGRCWVEWLVRLPPDGPVELWFATAIVHSGERPGQQSDGVRHRVIVRREAPAPREEVAFEELCAHRTWREQRVDLTRWTNSTVWIRLENDPGPARNTAFDQSAWAAPRLLAGRAREWMAYRTPSSSNAAERARQAVLALLQDKPVGENVFAWRIPDQEYGGAAVAVAFGELGLLDGAVALAPLQQAPLVVSGLRIEVEGQPVGHGPMAIVCRGVQPRRTSSGWEVRHDLVDHRGEFPLTVRVRTEGPALYLDFRCPRRTIRCSLGPWNAPASHVYWGHGYVVLHPGSFRQYAGGHNLASSYAGFEFAPGRAVLVGALTPPQALRVDPSQRVYTLDVVGETTLALIPGTNAMACARAWRDVDHRPAAPSVARLAGRFVFDIWGGRFVDIETNLHRMVRYGLTNSALIIHNWQRWGYDYRLPDIWPPNPAVGTVEELRRLGEFCRRHGILWGLHDNYIDFYPDASGFSYRRVYFSADGRPHPAWYNESRDARSFKWRPDCILPFVERNYRWIREEVSPTLSFVDVFASQPCGQWYDHEGRWHAPVEMRDGWAAAFDYIRRALDGAPTTSEAGHDHLIGHLDGADCQWLRLTSARHVAFATYLPCESWARVPWMDSAHHDRFVLYGAGYSGRFEGGLGRAAHGIHSDEYLAAEVLAGHSPMTDAGSWGRATVRKYWLLADVARSLAGRRIVGHSFSDGQIHRQVVQWDHGARVWVNQGAEDWAVGDAVLPQFGWIAKTPLVTAAVQRLPNGHRIEWARSPHALYLNARTVPMDGPAKRLPVEPRLVSLTPVSNRTVRYELDWEVQGRLRRDGRVFVHFVPLTQGAPVGEILGQDDFIPPTPTESWSGRVRHVRTFFIPAAWSGEVAMLVGLYDRRSRWAIRGHDDGEQRSWVGTWNIQATPTGLAVRIEPPKSVQPDLGLNPPGTRVDLGWISTDGAVRLQADRSEWRCIPLPDQPPFQLRVQCVAIGLDTSRVSRVTVETDEGPRPVPPGAVEIRDGWLVLRHDGDCESYRIELR